MEPRTVRVVAWSVAVLAVSLAVSAVILAALSDDGTAVDRIAEPSDNLSVDGGR